jgi:hypothetical protein
LGNFHLFSFSFIVELSRSFTEAMHEYPCLHLDYTKREIRILELHPGLEKDKIVCTLTSTILFEDRDYEALSYTLGNVDDVQMITLNDEIYPVTSILKCALRHLRKQDVIRRLWIDALCINQADNDERLHQVKLMKLIYQGASVVLVWLGLAGDSSDLAISFLEEKAMEIAA